MNDAFELGVKEAFLKTFKAKRAIKALGGVDAVKAKARDHFRQAMRFSDPKARRQEVKLLTMLRDAGAAA